MRRTVPLLVWCFSVIVLPRTALAQQVPDFDSRWSQVLEGGGVHWKMSGAVELRRDDMEFYADAVEIFTDRTTMFASGNVVFSSGGSRIAADRMEFDYKKRTGIFYNAAGSATLGDRVDRSMFGSQEPDAYFYGETLEKLGPKKYRITKGGFTTCVQPTPRWELTSGSVVLNLDDYALLRNSLFRVKGVPVLYLPIFYYPIQEDDRATGFLLPTYGTSTVRGQTISNAFFWAINRSQDATFFHDWFSKTGQGTGAEYRYVMGRGSDGQIRWYTLNEHATTVQSPGAAVATTYPARRSFEIRASAAQRLPAGLRARGRVDYFSNITIQQVYHQNIYESSQRERFYGGNLTGAWRAYTLNGTFDRREVFIGEEASVLHGAAPRISFSRNNRQIPGTPVYFSLGGEYAYLLSQEKRDDAVVLDRSLSRVDLTPALRAPLTTLSFLTVNAAAAYRTTYYTESLVNDRQVDEPITRRYFDLRSDVVGPVFTRVWNTPESGYAEKIKHVIEPGVNFQRITSVDNFERIVQLYDGGDYIVGGTTRITYGLTNRFLAKMRSPDGTGQASEFMSVAVGQTYYSNKQASQFDQQYNTSFRGREPSNFSPVAVVVRATPTPRTRGELRLEYDPQIDAIQSVTANGSLALGNWMTATGGWSQRRLETDRLNPDALRSDSHVNAGTTLRTSRNRIGGAYQFNYDLSRRTLLQQRITWYYNAQCCGFALEYQTMNFPAFNRYVVAQDRRFNFSFTLAGIGTFTNPFGALGGASRQ